MSNKKNQLTLADRIANDLNLVQASFDPEDDNLDDTRAQIDSNFEENDDEEEILSKFRKQNVALLADVDERYSGKKASRKNLDDFDVDSSDSDEQSEADVAEDSEAESADEGNQSSSGEQNEDEDNSEESKTDDEDNSEESKTDEEDVSVEGSVEDEMDYVDDSTKEEDNFKHLKETDVSSQIKKGLSIRNQMKMWESLLEMRIQLQKCLVTANKMPQADNFKEIKKVGGQEFSNQVAITKNSLSNVLEKLVLLQKLVLKKYPETKNLNKVEKKVATEDDDDEIASDTEEEKSSQESEDEESDIPKKKRKLKEMEKELSDQHHKYKKYRNSVIEKWNEKTRITMLKNKTNSHSIIDHIEYSLGDRAKLIKRTQLKRSDYAILGQELATETEKQNEEMQDVRLVEEYNSEIFDDDDFYHQLLRELIELKSADLTDPVQLGRQWIQLQNLRSKMKRKIDTRATKGRKIRYAVHTKLVNFMAPIDRYLWTDNAKTELYSSLFGKNQQFASA